MFTKNKKWQENFTESIRINSKSIEMELMTKKCALRVSIKTVRKYYQTEGIELSTKECIRIFVETKFCIVNETIEHDLRNTINETKHTSL